MAAHEALQQALRETATDTPVEEIDLGRDDAPAWVRGWGSPTTLIDGGDVTGAASPNGATNGAIGCPRYAAGATSAAEIRERSGSRSDRSPRPCPLRAG